jgi:hypothetical protein
MVELFYTINFDFFHILFVGKNDQIKNYIKNK